MKTELQLLDTEWATHRTLNNGWDSHEFNSFLKKSTQSELLTSQIPFYQAVEAFPRALSLLASKIKTSQERLWVVNNLYEEHGNGNPAKFHTESFKTFLVALGWDGQHQINPWIDEWVENKLLSCEGSAAEYAAYLSGIEYAYAPISDTIAKHLETLNLFCEQSHYSNHATLDWEHGEELLQVAYLINDDNNERPKIYDYFVKGQKDFLELYNHILIPTSFDIAEINKEPISFYYIREDFTAEKKALEHINIESSKNKKSILMIASGGENLIKHLCMESSFDIDAIDMNPHQIELCKSKIQKTLNDEKISNKEENYCGKFEKVFLMMRNYLGPYMGQQRVDKRIHQKLAFTVKIIFSNENLSLVFGDLATKFTKKSFSEHFYYVFSNMLLHSQFDNSFNIIRGDDFPHYKENVINLNKNFKNHTLNWLNTSFKDLSTDKKYDIINISNIGDWMPINEYKELLITLKNKLNKNGVLIARKLLGDYDLQEEMNNAGYKTELSIDHTLFYTQVVLGYNS